MLESTISEKDLETWASILLNHSLGGIEKTDQVMIKGERICWPLMRVLEQQVIQQGGIPDINIVPPNNERGRVWSAAMGHWADQNQLQSIPAWHRARYENMTKYIEVLGAEDPQQYAALTAEQMTALASCDHDFANIRLSKPWVLTLYPTQAFAKLEGMALSDYTDFIVQASTTDPKNLKQAEERIAPLIDRAQRVEIRTQYPAQNRQLSLSMSIEPSCPTLSFGSRNFPDGEVFTSPDANSPQGEIYVDLPVHYGGHDLQGIYLKLEQGQIVDYSAHTGQEKLKSIIETDAGSRRLGEVAWGMNPGLTKVLKHPLFVEKVGGTLHIAIGQSYADCYKVEPGQEQAQLDSLKQRGIFNESAQHVDIVCDFRTGGAGSQVFLDDSELVVNNGIWEIKA